MNPLRFIPVAQALANLSKDPSTKVGAIVVSDDGSILSMGFNGFPRGVLDNRERYEHRPIKLSLISHAESNAIAQAARHGIRLLGSTMIVTALYPCSSCAKQIIQAGIVKIVYPSANENTSQHWIDEWNISKTMFSESGVNMVEYDS